MAGRARSAELEVAPDPGPDTELGDVVTVVARAFARLAVHHLARRPDDLRNALVLQLRVLSDDEYAVLRRYLDEHGGA